MAPNFCSLGIRQSLMKVLKLEICLVPTLNQYLSPVTCSTERLNLMTKRLNLFIQRFSHHPSIIKIKQNMKISAEFSFTPVTVETVKSINGLPENISVSSDIPLNVLRSSEFTFCYLTECINKVLGNISFPDSSKVFGIVILYKKTNFQPICILSLVSKVFEKIIFDQLYNCLNKFLNSLLAL